MFGPASQLETDRHSSSAGLAADQRKLVKRGGRGGAEGGGGVRRRPGQKTLWTETTATDGKYRRLGP